MANQMVVCHSTQQCRASEYVKKSRARLHGLQEKGVASFPSPEGRKNLLSLQGPDFLPGQEGETVPLSILCLLSMAPLKPQGVFHVALAFGLCYHSAG